MKKKILVIFIALLMVMGFATGCGGKYVPPGGNGSLEIDPGDKDGDSTNTSNEFSVTLMLNGEEFKSTDGIRAVWNDGLSQPIYANFVNGVAKTKGLDGDYRVTLEGLSNTYTYDPNGNYATNFTRDIKINIYKVISIRIPGSQQATAGKTLYDAVEMTALGAYRVTVRSSLEPYYYLYAPKKSGTYVIKSLINISDNHINPKFQECHGTRSGIREPGQIIDGGGASSTYTNNFRYEYYMNADNISVSEGGAVILFGILAEARTLEFPLSIDIIIERDGDYVRDDLSAEMAVTKEFAEVENSIDFPEVPTPVTYPSAGYDAYVQAVKNRIQTIRAMPQIAEKRAEADALMKQYGTTFKYVYSPTNILDGSRVKFNKDTGYYHVYDEVTGYGAVLCAKITSATEVLDSGFSTVEYAGNKALTINDNYDYWYRKTTPKYPTADAYLINYKIFIEGYCGIVSHEGPPNTYVPGIAAQYADYANRLGYADFANNNGCYPVTEELRRFLQGYATQARLFMDGKGNAEPTLMSPEEDQWLFACGYYA